jgi:hypothetical protein
MSMRHTTDDLVERYSMGGLEGEALAEVEEHLLRCAPCRRRVQAADDFLATFRAAAAQPHARPVPGRARQWAVRKLYWATAAAAAALLTFVVLPWRPASDPTPVVLEMQSLRGPELGVHVARGRELLLRFDVLPQSANSAYEMEIINADGSRFATREALVQDGRLTARTGKLPKGAYWIRIYSRELVRELRAEYRLTIE